MSCVFCPALSPSLELLLGGTFPTHDNPKTERDSAEDGRGLLAPLQF